MDEKSYEYKPYERCLGRKFGRNRRKRKLRKLNRPLAIIFRTKICENLRVFPQKRKFSCLQQIFRSFFKDAIGFRVDAWSKSVENCKMESGDIIRVVAHVSKAVIRKFLSRLNYELDDYKLLRRRIYTLLFELYICDTVMNNDSKNITLDLHTQVNDMFKFIVTLNKYYSDSMIQMLMTYFIEERDGRPV
jgi:hypothetical protein